MTTPFRKRIQASIENPVLQDALDGNAERRIRVRRESLEALGEPEKVIANSRAVRAETIAHLDTYLDQLIRMAEANGLIVHRAQNAAEAIKIVLQIAESRGAKRIAKSKTMLGEEIEINPALEEAGLEVVETDLGEYIVQLRGEPPSHIITPAVHLRRGEVGQTFHEKLGIPFTDDIPTLTQAARKVLREVFLTADIGISGVNFAVAQTGTLCILTNEGNGRMVTTLPPIHIALMGVERIVPTFDDLALFLDLLPRSATGQKLTVYTSLINSPRRSRDADGPQERHLVLVDNGRMHLRESPLAEILYCIRCGACLNACPVFREIGGHAYVGASGNHTPYPGPIGSVISPALFSQPEFGNLARASSLCGACKDACPAGIDLPKLLLRVRAGGLQAKPGKVDSNVPWYLRYGLSVFARAAVHPRLYRLCQNLLGIASRLVSSRGWMRLPAFTGWGYSKDFPTPAVRPFSSQFKAVDQETGSLNIAGNGRNHPKLTPPVPEVPVAGIELIPPEKLTIQFIQELEALGGKVIQISEEKAGEKIAQFLQERELREVLSWSAQQLPNGLLDGLAEVGIQLTEDPDPSVMVGLTGAIAGAAETGSILVTSGEGLPLAASLLPEIHLVILPECRISASLGELLNHDAVRNSAASTLITGPSRTADIEMALTIGVHGPGEVIVFLTSTA